MTESIMPYTLASPEALPTRRLDRLARRMTLALMRHIRLGRITIEDAWGRHTFGEVTDRVPLTATIQVHHLRSYTRTIFGGSIGAAEAYMTGLWRTDALTDLIRIFVLNQQAFEEMDSGWMRLTEPFYKLCHFLRRNTVAGSRENIVAHYDLGNDFYRLFLDPTMTYSAGIFQSPETTLEQASIAKYDRICRKLNLGPEDHVLEIGTGWGGFALHAAGRYGCRVTTTTISDQQYAYARQRVAAAGLADRITLLKEDYRHLQGSYDKLVSIEMIEAVGHQYLPLFFDTCSRLLKDDGVMLLQSITIRDQVYDQHRTSVDFIKRYIFPGSCIPSISAMSRVLGRKTDLKLYHLEDITPHYVRTLYEWRQRFFKNIDQVRRMGFSDAFIRMWEYYLCYCEAGFAEHYIGNVQMVLGKPMYREAAILIERHS